MSMLLDTQIDAEHKIKVLAAQISRPQSKFNLSVERKIEGMWLDAKELGWDFNRFLVFIIEVMTIMHYRNCTDVNTKPVAPELSKTSLPAYQDWLKS